MGKGRLTQKDFAKIKEIMDRPQHESQVVVPDHSDEFSNPFQKVFNSNEYDGWDNFFGRIVEFNLEVLVAVFYLPLFLFLPTDQANEMYFGALKSVKEGTEIAGLVLAAPFALGFAALSLPFDMLVGSVYFTGVAIETSYYWVESLIIGKDINDLVSQNA